MSTVNLEHPSLADVGRAVEPDDFGDLADLYVAAMHKRAPRKVNLCSRVGALVQAIATCFRLPAERVRRLELAAAVHRIGELALPDEIVDSCFLDHDLDNRSTYSTYPRITARFFEEVADDPDLVVLLSMHRQFYLDQKLSEHEFYRNHLLDTQILCAATEYEEMMLMKDDASEEVVRRFMNRSRGLRYNPEVVDRLLEIVGH